LGEVEKRWKNGGKLGCWNGKKKGFGREKEGHRKVVKRKEVRRTKTG